MLLVIIFPDRHLLKWLLYLQLNHWGRFLHQLLWVNRIQLLFLNLLPSTQLFSFSRYFNLQKSLILMKISGNILTCLLWQICAEKIFVKTFYWLFLHWIPIIYPHIFFNQFFSCRFVRPLRTFVSLFIHSQGQCFFIY